MTPPRSVAPAPAAGRGLAAGSCRGAAADGDWDPRWDRHLGIRVGSQGNTQIVRPQNVAGRTRLLKKPIHY